MQNSSVTRTERETINLLDLPDSILLSTIDFLNDKELLQIEQVSKSIRNLYLQGTLQQQWKIRCQRRWEHLPRYRLTPSRQNWLDENVGTECWKERYLWGEYDLCRTVISKNELETLDWYFNFTPHSGGRGRDTLRRCIFRDGLLLLFGFPPLPYQLVQLGARQALIISNFPPHYFYRIPSCGEWLIKNFNVTLVSTDEEGTLTYTDRGFQEEMITTSLVVENEVGEDESMLTTIPLYLGQVVSFLLLQFLPLLVYFLKNNN